MRAEVSGGSRLFIDGQPVRLNDNVRPSLGDQMQITAIGMNQGLSQTLGEIATDTALERFGNCDPVGHDQAVRFLLFGGLAHGRFNPWHELDIC